MSQGLVFQDGLGLNTGNFLSLELGRKKVKKTKKELDVYQRTKEEVFDKIELPSRFTSEIIKKRFIEFTNSEEGAINKNDIEIIDKNQLGLENNRIMVYRYLNSNREYQKFPPYLFNFFKSLRDFYSHVLERNKQSREGINFFFFNSDVSSDFIDLLDLSFQTEDIGALALVNIIDETASKMARSTLHTFDKKEEMSFCNAVKRSSKRKIIGLINEQMQKVDKIFELANEAENRKLKSIWYLRIWNCDTISDLPFPDKLEFEKVNEKTFTTYYSEFINEHRCFREYLLENYFDCTLKIETLEDSKTEELWDEAIDILIQ